MDYYIRFYTHDGYERLEPAGGSLPAAVKEAERMSKKYDGVEVVAEGGVHVWPYGTSNTERSTYETNY